MRRASVLLVALLVAGGFSALALRGSRARAGAVEAASAAKDTVPAGAVAQDGDEVRRLRAALQTKDRIIRELVAQGAAKDATNANLAASAAAHGPTDRGASLEHARKVLDERLATPAASGSSAELERELTTVLDPSALGATRITSRRCSGAMCRVTIAADTPAAMNASLETMMERLPKVFAGTAVYAAEDDTRALYLARTNDDLAIDTPSDAP